MKKKTKFGLLLGAVAAATFYVVHKIAGKKPSKPASAPPEHVTAPPTSAPKAPAPAPAPHAPADPSAPLPGQESLDGNVHFDQPGGDPSAPLPGQANPGIHFDQPATSSDTSSLLDDILG